ncbi:MAG: hypothetical protein KME30_32210 [Iphinoe sp. HA4291-MV1]|jgi:hypothetical protein|nr:hypothetical protein [Iphinoe sp. HA4291-MV1]
MSVTEQKKSDFSFDEKENLEWYRSQGAYFIAVQRINNEFMPFLKKNRAYVWGGGLHKDLQHAKDAAVVAYHQQAGDLVNGERLEIDIELLVYHPKNADIYYADEYESLAKQLDVEDPWIERLEVNAKGEIIHGNRRRRAAAIVNERALARGEAKKFPTLPIEVVQFDTEEEELRRLLLHNQTRIKTNSVRTLEGIILLEIEQQLANRRKAIAKKRERTPEEEALLNENKGVRSTQKVADAVGYGSASTFENSTNVIAAIQEVRKDDPELADEWLKVHDQKSIKTASDVLKIPQDIRKEICKRINQTQGRINVAKIANEVQAQKAKVQANQLAENGKLNLKSTIVLQKALGDKPNDNWYTPDWLVKLCLDVCGREKFDVDMFADLTKRVPAVDHITVEQDAFKTDCKFDLSQKETIVFGNILYSDQAKCFGRIDQQISSGSITEGFWIAESGAMHSKACQEVLDKHNMLVCFWRGSKEESVDKELKKSRISFVPGDYLLAYLKYGKNRKEDDNWVADVPDDLVSQELDDLRGKNDNNRFNSIIIYYGKNKESFYRVFNEYGRVSYSHQDLVAIASQDMALPEWVEGVASYMGRELAIAPNEQDLYDVLVDEKIVFDTAETPEFAKALAIAYCLQFAQSNPF